MIREAENGSLADILDGFCRYLENRGKSPLTIKNYRSDLQGFVRWLELREQENLVFGNFTSNDFDRYRESVIRRYTSGTTYRKLTTLKAFLRWASESKLVKLQEFPKLDNVKLNRKEPFSPRWLKMSDQIRLRQAVEAGGKARDVAVIKLMLNTGIRTGELCALRWTAVKISDDEGTLTIPRRKRRASVPLNLEARNALISIGYRNEAGHDQFVFKGRTGPMTVRGVDMLVERYSKVAGITNVTPGMLRHTFCMNLANAGVSPLTIARLIGTSSMNMNMIRGYLAPPNDDRVPEFYPGAGKGSKLTEQAKSLWSEGQASIEDIVLSSRFDELLQDELVQETLEPTIVAKIGDKRKQRV
jgi:integrase/recombinase XerC